MQVVDIFHQCVRESTTARVSVNCFAKLFTLTYLFNVFIVLIIIRLIFLTDQFIYLVGKVMRKFWVLIAIGSVFLAASTADAQYQQGGCLTESPPVNNGPGYPMTAPPPGRTFCAPPGGTIIEDQNRVLVCSVGQCMEDSRGQALCAREPVGSVIVDVNGTIKCVGGCVRPNRQLCRVPQR